VKRYQREDEDHGKKIFGLTLQNSERQDDQSARANLLNGGASIFHCIA